MTLDRDLEWYEQAACAGQPSALFFPGDPDRRGGHQDYKPGQKFCAVCPVAKECLAYALASEKPGERRAGLWGGMTPRDRDRYARARRKGAA